MRKKEPMFVGAGPEMLSARAPAEDWSSGCIGGGGGDKGGTGGRSAEPRGGTGGQRGGRRGKEEGRRHRQSQNRAACHARFPNWGNHRQYFISSKYFSPLLDNISSHFTATVHPSIRSSFGLKYGRL